MVSVARPDPSRPRFVPPAPASPGLAPAAPAAPAARLRVIQDGAQDCSTCRNVQTCWKPQTDNQATVLNLLVCRIQRGIAREKSTRLFLKLIRPKLLKIAKWVRSRTGMPIMDAVREMESVSIETLITTYVMGEVVPPIVYLFNDRYGAVRHWAVRTVAEAKKRRATDISYDASDLDLEQRVAQLNRLVTQHRVQTPPPPLVEGETEDEVQARQALVDWVMRIIEDGVTLPVAEYRVIRFCLSVGPGAHRYLQQVAKRKQVSRLHAMGCRRIIEALGRKDAYLRSKGIRSGVVRRVDASRRLTADEILEVLRLLEEGHGTVMDVAWALGATDATVHNVRRRYAGKTVEEIRALCATRT